MLSARAIAVQGVGFTPKLVAMQGLRPYEVRPPADVIPYAGYTVPRKKKRRRDRDDDVLLFLLR